MRSLFVGSQSHNKHPISRFTPYLSISSKNNQSRHKIDLSSINTAL